MSTVGGRTHVANRHVLSIGAGPGPGLNDLVREAGRCAHLSHHVFQRVWLKRLETAGCKVGGFTVSVVRSLLEQIAGAPKRAWRHSMHRRHDVGLSMNLRAVVGCRCRLTYDVCALAGVRCYEVSAARASMLPTSSV